MSSCPANCPYTIIGYCYNSGACINGACVCDNSTLSLDSSCSLESLWSKLIGVWIACIVVGFIVVFIIPIIICCCCCGLCAAAAAESKPIHHHHHHQHQDYNTVPTGVVFPNPGQPYIQANAYQQPQGFPQQGYPQQGYPPQQGFPPQQGQPPQQGFPPQQGQPQQGFPPQNPGFASYYISQPVTAPPPFNGEPDAEALYKAMKGLGTNDSVLSNIFATRTRDQLQEIKKTFERKYGKTLESWVKGETSGHYEDLLLSLLHPKDDYDAELVKNAVKGLGTDDDELIETLCTRNNQELVAMKAAYQRLYHVDMEKDVRGDTRGDYKNLLLAVLAANRPEAQPVNIEDAKRDAQRLYAAGEGRMGTDEKVFVEILTQRSLPQLHTIANCYGTIANHSLESGISKETSGNFKKAMLILCTPKDEYFAHALRKAIEGSGTNDKKLIRNLSYLSNNKDLFRAVNSFYMHAWKHNVSNDVGGDTSGWYKKTAQALIANRVNL